MGYSQYKIVDNPWLKKVPSTWDMIPNKVLFTKRQVKVGENFYKYQLLSLTTQGIKEKDINDVKGKVPASYNNYQMVRPGDMVFCLFDLDVSAVFAGVSPYSGMITSAYDVAECNEEYIIPQYMNYWFQYVFFGRHYKMYSKNVRYTLSFDAFGSIKTPVPPRAEQDQIVRYLDWKVSEINRLIILRKQEISRLEELKRSQIGNLVMGGNQSAQKKSEVTWVDSIPQSWDEVTLVQVAQEQKIKNTGLIEDNLLSLSYGKIINKDINTTDGLLPASFEGYQIVHPGNIILRLTDLQNDHKSLRTGYVTQAGIITSAYTCLEPRNNILPEYLQLQLHTADLCKVFYGMGGGVRQSIGFDEIRKMIIALPPINDQRKIIEQVHDIESPIDAVSDKYKEIISLLEEYKTKLISDVVTGQIDVRDIEIPEYEYVEETADIDSEEMTEFDESEDEEV